MGAFTSGLASDETSHIVLTATEITEQRCSCTDTPEIISINASSDAPGDQRLVQITPAAATHPVEISSSNQISVEVPARTEHIEDNTSGSETAAETPKVTYQSLPSELLLEIFRYATFVPRSRKLTPGDPFLPSRPDNGSANTSAMSARTKFHLVLVCKEWRRLANELLYEYVVISSLRRARLLSRTLTETAQKTPQNGISSSQIPGANYSLGHWIRHLEVHSGIRNSEKNPFLNGLASILIKCTNLLSFSAFWTYEVPAAFLDGLLQTTKNTLHGLSWTQPQFRFDYNGTISEPILTSRSLNSLRNLKILELLEMPKHSFPVPARISAGEDESALVQRSSLPVSQSGIVLPCLSTLRIASVPALFAFASTISLPSLDTVIVDSSATYSDFSEFHPQDISTASSPLTYTLIQFIAVHGRSIRSLEIVPPKDRQRIRSGPGDEPVDGRRAGYIPSPYPISPGFFLQPGLCPDLQSIVFDCRERSMVYPISFELAVGLTGRHSNGRGSVSPTPSDAFDGTVPSAPPTLIFDIDLPLSISSKPTLLTQRHATLRRVGIRGLDINRLYPSKPCHSQEHLLSLLNLKEGSNDLLPSLTRAQAIDLHVENSWDGNAKDIFIWWAERFDVVGTDLVDGECVLWLYDEELPPKKKKGKSRTAPPI